MLCPQGPLVHNAASKPRWEAPRGQGMYYSVLPGERMGQKNSVLSSPTQGNFLAKAQVKMVEKDKVPFKCARYDIFSAGDCG